MGGLLDEIARNLNLVFGGQIHGLVGETERARELHKHSCTLWLLGIEQEGVLVVVECPHERDQQHQYYEHPSIHPVQEDDDEDGRHAYSPEPPQEERDDAPHGFNGAEPHVAI